jgi:hypothetical protein
MMGATAAAPETRPLAAAEGANEADYGSFRDPVDNNRDARAEERWHASLVHLAQQYRDQAASASEKHDRAGYGARLKHLVLALPGPIINLVAASVAALWDAPEDNKYLIVPLVLVGAVFSTVHSVLNLGGKAEQYWRYAALYGGVVARVDKDLARDPDWRTPADAFFAEISSNMGNLNMSAPQLPGKGCCGCSKYESPQPLPAPSRMGEIDYEAA